jgi:hypothetical protein
MAVLKLPGTQAAEGRCEPPGSHLETFQPLPGPTQALRERESITFLKTTRFQASALFFANKKVNDPGCSEHHTIDIR